ncbi:MAG: antitoxin [Acidimicrobiia bacterium]|jgi:hypothetical protein|nr:antitoxin [Acidimicrobiia bacterium]
MRTTVTLDPDVEALVRKAMTERHLTFKEAVNAAIRTGLLAGSNAEREPYRVPVRALGPPRVPLTKALQLAADLEDDEIVRELALGK